MLTTKKQINLFVSSNPSNNAQNLSSDGSTFEVIFGSDTIQIPQNAKNLYLSIEHAEIWNIFPNISDNISNKIIIENTSSSQIYTLSIPAGSYSVSTLQDALKSELHNANLAEDLIEIRGNQSTQKVEIQFNYPSIRIDFTQSSTSTIRNLLGFNSGLYGNFIQSDIPQVVSGQSTANFNTVNSLEIHTDLVTNGLRKNSTYSRIAGVVPISANVGSQISYQPVHPTRVPCPHLRGHRINSAKFWLTNELSQYVNTGGEYWSALVSIEYETPDLTV